LSAAPSNKPATDFSATNSFDRRTVADLVIFALIAHPFFSRTKPAMFHGDPHAGNLFFTCENRLAILDWSLVGWLNERELFSLMQLFQASATLNGRRIVELLRNLAERGRINGPALSRLVASRLRLVRQGQFPGFNWLIGLLDEAVQTAGLRFATDLMMLRKSLHTIDGVLAAIGAAESQIDRTLFSQFLGHFAAEWPRRWLTAPNSRDFATHLSNADIAKTVLAYPAAVGQFWLGHSFDMLDTYCRITKRQSCLPRSTYQSSESNNNVANC